MILKIGHRGAMGYEPENTLVSFQRAIEFGVDMIELDIHLCHSGELVVIHDETVDRTTNGSGRVEDKSLAELQSLDAGFGQKVSTLIEVLNFINKRVKVNVELKGEGTVEPLCEVIQKYISKHSWSYGDFYVSAFDHYKLRKMHLLDKKIKTGALLVGRPIGLAEFATQVNAFSVNLCYQYVDEEFIADAHRRGLKVFVWTVNEPDDIKKIIELGVDGICSNYPDRLNKFL